MVRKERLIFKVSNLVLFFFLFTQIFNPAPALAAPALVAGTIQKITPLADNQFEILLKTEKGTAKYIVDASLTQIQAVVSAKSVKRGANIVVNPAAERKGVPGIKSPFKNMAPAVRDALGLPQMPEVPGTPDVPAVPKIPQIPQVPEVPKAPKAAPVIPKAPQIPTVPQVPGRGPAPPKGAAPAAAPQGAAPPAEKEMGGAPPSAAGPGLEEEVKPKGFEGEIPEPPKEARSSMMKPPAISKPTPTYPKIVGKKVVSLEQSAEGIKVELEGAGGATEQVTLKPEEKVLQVLTIQDLKKNMNVQLEVAEGTQDNFVQRVTIA
jgi:hypothetical protein